MNQFIAKLINKAHGLGTHEPANWIQVQYTKYGTCKHCLEKIWSTWVDDEDRGEFWSEWKGERNCSVPTK